MSGLSVRRLRAIGLAVASLGSLALLQPALAHEVEGTGSGLLAGFLHPILGPDHLVAMVAVGLLGAQLGRPLIVALPVAFPVMMAVGAVLSILGMPLPGVEIGISLSAVALGLAVLLAWKAPVSAAIALVALFALFHGHAHGTEIPEAADPAAYGVGFVTATGLLHLAGVLVGLLHDRPGGAVIVRAAGGVVALVGAWFLIGSVT